MMWFRTLCETMNEWPSSMAIRGSVSGYPALLTAHLVSMGLFAGLVIMMDLRLLGVGNMRTPFSQIQRRLFPWQMVGMATSSITGLALFYAEPMRFYANIFFWIKGIMLVLAGVNALAFHYSTYDSVAGWDTSRLLPSSAKMAAVVSLVLWVLVIMSGRLIAYNWFQQR
jgi:hypothetical protein